MMRSRCDLSVIVPAYNEAKNLPILFERIAMALEHVSYEIILVDDDSPDRTWEVAESQSEKFPIRVIRRIHERGLSSAVLTGMSVADGKVFAVIDADLQHDESILPQMYSIVANDGYDICVGSRGNDEGSYGDWSIFRRFISFIAAWLARFMLPVKINDPMSGFFAISRQAWKETVHEINPRGFKILLEFIGRNRGLKVRELGYTFRNRLHGETKLSGSVIRTYIIALLEIRFGKFVSPIFFIYCLVGGTGVIINFIGFKFGELFGMPHLYTGISDRFDPIYTAVPFGYQLAVISNYILNNYITFYEKRHHGAYKFFKGFALFEIVSLFGLLVHTAAFQLLHVNGFLRGIIPDGSDVVMNRAVINNGFAIIIAMVSNYYLNVNITWGATSKRSKS